MSAPEYWSRVPLAPEWGGRAPYLPTLERARAQREACLAGRGREVLWLYEHDAVLTTGRRPVPDLPPPSFWASKGIPVVATERGGLATLHAPGQVVAHLVLDLPARGLGVRRAVHAIEGGLIAWLGRQGIHAGRRAGAPGVWVGRDKIASLGLHVREGVTLHGFALNVDVELEPFGWFTPCGVADAGTTSVRALLGRAPDLSDVASEAGNEVLWCLLESAVDRAVDSQ